MPARDFVVMIPIGNDDLAAADVKWVATHPHYYGLSARNHHSFFILLGYIQVRPPKEGLAAKVSFLA